VQFALLRKPHECAIVCINRNIYNIRFIVMTDLWLWSLQVETILTVTNIQS